MLCRWGVDTVVIIGAWTEDCITSTAFEATDRYGFDVVVVKDAVGTATGVHTKAIDVMEASCAKVHTHDNLIMIQSSSLTAHTHSLHRHALPPRSHTQPSMRSACRAL